MLSFIPFLRNPVCTREEQVGLAEKKINLKLHCKLSPKPCLEGYTKPASKVSSYSLLSCYHIHFCHSSPFPLPLPLATPRMADKISAARAAAEVRYRALCAAWRCAQQQPPNCCLLLPFDPANLLRFFAYNVLQQTRCPMRIELNWVAGLQITKQNTNSHFNHGIQVLRNAESKYIFVFRPPFVPFARGNWMYSVPEALFLRECLAKWTCCNHYTWNISFVKTSIHCFCHKIPLPDLLTLLFTSLHSNQALFNISHFCHPSCSPCWLFGDWFPWALTGIKHPRTSSALVSRPGWGKNCSALSCRCKLGCSSVDQVAGFANQSLTSMLLQTNLNKYSAHTDLISLHS